VFHVSRDNVTRHRYCTAFTTFRLILLQPCYCTALRKRIGVFNASDIHKTKKNYKHQIFACTHHRISSSFLHANWLTFHTVALKTERKRQFEKLISLKSSQVIEICLHRNTLLMQQYTLQCTDAVMLLCPISRPTSHLRRAHSE